MNTKAIEAQVTRALDRLLEDVKFGLKTLGLDNIHVEIDKDFGNYGGVSVNQGEWVATPDKDPGKAIVWELEVGSMTQGSRYEQSIMDWVPVNRHAPEHEALEWLCLGPFRDKLVVAFEDREVRNMPQENL